MTGSIDPALVARLSGEFTALGTQMGALGRDLDLLRRQVLEALPGDRAGEQPAPGAAGGVDGTGADVTGGAGGPGGQAVPGTVGGGRSDAASVASAGAGQTVPGRVSQETAAPGQAVHEGTRAHSVPPAGRFPGYAPAPGGYVPPASGYVPSAPGGYVPPAPGGYVPPGRPGVPFPGRPAYGAPPPQAWRRPPPAPRPPAPVRVNTTPWWQRDGMISRVLAVAGVAVTLIGVVMLLVLAAQAGLFGPVPRVVAGALFSAALVGAGLRVADRPGGRVGGIALAATGVAGAYLDVVAVTGVYDWLHPVPGFAVALGIAAGGVALALRWNSQPLAVLTVVGAALAAPFVTTAPVLLGFLVVAQLSCLPVHRMRDWPYLHLARTLPVVFATVAFIAVAGLSDARGHVGAVLAASIAVAVVGLAGTLLVQRIRPTDVTASYALAAAAAPLLVAPPTLLDRWPAVALAACYAAVLLAVAAAHLAPATRARTGITSHTAVVAAVLGAVALLEACVGGANTRTLALVLFLAALAFSGVAGHQRSRVAAVLGAAFAVLGGLVFLDDAGPAVLASRVLARDHLGIDTAVTALAGLAVLAATVWSLRRMSTAAGSAGAGNPVVWVATSVAALYLVSAAAVAVGVAAGGTDGFVVGHCVATILWMAGATGALFHGLRNLWAGSGAIVKVALGSGLLLTAAAIAKLFLFDLATLDGFVRVSAFLAVGVLLLLTGTRYARAFAEAGERAGRERDAVPSGAAPGAPGPAGDQSVSS